ncbi:aminotransferase class I/II-fold pyridoxal phosphate-dependent enzyme [Actinoplanes sp. NPDC023936]|uniref:MalY/PatB family protein n=1 Tax=Actinoplanes sp. NPDC023936 TaxID=3154910 RepID=UPI0033CE3CE3
MTIDGNPLRRLSLDQLRRRTSEKWRTYPPDVLPVFVAEMDAPLADPVVRAITDAVRLGDTGYPAGSAYAEALDGFARTRWGWKGVEPARTRVVADVMAGILEVLGVISEPGRAVVVSSPTYPPYYIYVRRTGRPVEEAPLGADGRLDPASLDAAFRRAGPGATYLLCNPQNPTATVHTAAELSELAALADRHGLRVVSDEIFAPLVLPGTTFVPYLSVPGASRGFAVLSATKGWNLAGLKAALVVAGPDAADDLAGIPEWVREGASHVGVIAHTAAFRDGGEWLDAVLAGIDENRRLLASLLATELPKVGYRPGESTYLAWLDCRELGLGDDPAAVFLERGRVAFVPGPTFGAGGAGHVRFNIGTSPEVVTEAVRRMAAALPG